MSKDSSKKPVKKEQSVSTSDVQWGPIPAVIVSFLIFVVPQFFLILCLRVINDINPDLLDFILNEDNIAMNFVLVGITELISIGLLYLYLKRSNFKLEALKLEAKPTLAQMALTLPAFGLYFILSGLFLFITQSIFPNVNLDQEQIVGFENASTVFEIGLAFIALVIVAPIVEEIIFRGFLFQGLRSKLSFGWAAVISSALFGVAHGQLNVAIDVFALGVVLCWLLEDTKTLWPSIMLHGLKNLIAFTFLFLVDTSFL